MNALHPNQSDSSHNANAASSLKILLAEDNFVNQRLALMQLEQLGYQADLVSDGEAVLQALQNQAYDIILMDVHMPKMCGITATQEICQRYPKEQRPYIIALTACAEEQDAANCLAAGMQGYVTKPIEPAALTQALEQAKHHRQHADEKDSGEISPTPTENTESSPAQSSEHAESNQVDANQRLEKADIQAIPILDEQVIASICKMAGPAAPELLKQLFSNYQSEAPVMLENIYRAIETNDCTAMYKAAHSLRSSSANLGLLQLSKVCELIEDQGREEKMVNLDEYKPVLQARYRAAQAEFIRYT